MKETGINTDLTRKGFEMAEKAMSVYCFISELPSPYGEFVFKNIIEDARTVASVLTDSTALSQFIDAVCDCIYAEADSLPLMECLGMTEHQDEFDEMVLEREELKRIVRKYMTISSIPSDTQMMSIMSCFTPTRLEDDKRDIVLNSIQNRMLSITKSNPDIEKKLKASVSIPQFHYLGYLTRFHEWFSMKQSTLEENVLFYQWYSKGMLLDIVLDTVFKCGVSAISKDLWDYIQKACNGDYHLADLFNRRYNELSRFYRWADTDPFEFLGIRNDTTKEDAESIKLSLPKIMKEGGAEPYSTNEVGNIYRMLVQSGYIDKKKTTIQDFLRAFDGNRSPVKQIVWEKGQKSLATFLLISNGTGKTNKEHAEMAAKVFIQKNGKACSAVTLIQPDYGIIKDLTDKITDAANGVLNV